MRKHYATASTYEDKLRNVMRRLDVKEYDWNHDRYGSWVQFRYKGDLYRFDHTIQKAADRKIKLEVGSDCFAQIVLSLEDLARMVERGIYDLKTWVAGMKAIEHDKGIPSFFAYLGFTGIPRTAEDVRAAFREKAKIMHPDAGGDPEDFHRLKKAEEQGIKYFNGR